MDSEEEEGYGGKGVQKRKVLSQTWNSEGLETDDESGESMELMEEVPLIGLVWVRIGEINMHAFDGEAARVDPRDEGKI